MSSVHDLIHGSSSRRQQQQQQKLLLPMPHEGPGSSGHGIGPNIAESPALAPAPAASSAAHAAAAPSGPHTYAPGPSPSNSTAGTGPSPLEPASTQATLTAVSAIQTPTLDAPPQPISRWGFEYNGTLTWKGIVRRDVSYLKSICFPEQESDLAIKKRAQDEATKTLTIKFISAQLNHYGVQFPPGIKRDGLLTWLKNALTRGQCDKVPDYLEERIQGMIMDFEPRREAYEAWKRANSKRARRTHFNTLPNLSAQINYDADFFMEAYFLDDTGNPEPHKCTSILTIIDVARPYEVVEAVSKVFGLYFTWSQLQGNRTVFIGWNHALMCQTRESHDRSIGRQQKTQRDARGRIQMARHQEYIDIINRTQLRQEFSLIGSYVLFCDALEEQVSSPNIKLDILPGKTPNLYDGIFRFSILTGFLILTPDTKPMDIVDLEEQERYGPNSFFDFGATQLQQLSSVPQTSPRLFASTRWPQNIPNPQTQEQQQASNPISGLSNAAIVSTGSKRRATTQEPSHASPIVKKPRVAFSSNVTRRFRVQWEGRFAEGEVPSEYPQSDDGWIEFKDGRYCSFSGLVNMAFTGGERRLQGYKVSDVPKRPHFGYA